jgi:peptide chain release factor
MDKHIIQITAGTGPEECCLAAALTLKEFLKEVKAEHITHQVIDRISGQENGTISSALIQIEGNNLEPFLQKWIGVICWVVKSPYRSLCKRKNWFVGVEKYDESRFNTWNEHEIQYQTLRGSGPGGQHVNKVETTVRATHLPTGLQVVVSDTRSQLQNRKLATERLKTRLDLHQITTIKQNQQKQWTQHKTLERGNPIRTFHYKKAVKEIKKTIYNRKKIKTQNND